jgi:hypothetical protein
MTSTKRVLGRSYKIFGGLRSKPSQGKTLLYLTWLYTKASQTFSKIFLKTPLNLNYLYTKASENLPLNFLQNPIKSYLSLHQNLPKPSIKTFPDSY